MRKSTRERFEKLEDQVQFLQRRDWLESMTDEQLQRANQEETGSLVFDANELPLLKWELERRGLKPAFPGMGALEGFAFEIAMTTGIVERQRLALNVFGYLKACSNA